MKKTIALFLYDPKCSVQSGNGVIKSLQERYNFKIFGNRQLEDNFFDDVDAVLIPGGFGDADSFDSAFKYSGERVKEFVRKGGKYIGICMGAYWAGRHYLDILEDVDAVEFMKRPGSKTFRPHAKNMPIMWQDRYGWIEPYKMFWYDGCALVGDSTKYETIATYNNNGDAMAIIQNNIGLIGCHPESEEFWYDSYSWMKAHYHRGNHHTLLLDFVDRVVGAT